MLSLQISPDSRWMAYSSGESGELGIYVRPFPDVDGGLWQLPTGGAIGCVWSPNGREFIYSSIENRSLMAVEVETEPTFKFGRSQALFNAGDIGLRTRSIVGDFDISPDGKRFLMLKKAATTDEESQAEESVPQILNKITIILNWFEELNERLPVQ